MGKLSHYEVSLLGAKASGEANKKKALEGYYKDPNHCKWCGEVIHPDAGKKTCVSTARRKKFCNHSCAAKQSNKDSPKRKGISSGLCNRCEIHIDFKRFPSGGYSPRKYCDSCLKMVKVENGTKNVWHNFEPIPFEEQTKADVKRRNHNSYMWWSNHVNAHARKVYKESGRAYECKHCGYNLHVNICHVKDIKDFPDTALVKEINDPDNLVALCKNHHWEFDHGILKLEENDDRSN